MNAVLLLKFLIGELFRWRLGGSYRNISVSFENNVCTIVIRLFLFQTMLPSGPPLAPGGLEPPTLGTEFAEPVFATSLGFAMKDTLELDCPRTASAEGQLLYGRHTRRGVHTLLSRS